MSIRHALQALVVLSMLGPVWAEDVRAQTAFTVKYGNGWGQLGRDTNPETRREYTGPSSIRTVGNDEILVCDPINHRVHRLAPNGQMVDIVTIPAINRHDAELVGIDAGIDKDRTLCVLELADRSVHRFALEKQKFLNPWTVPANEDGGTILNALAIDPQGHVMVFDGSNNRVIRFNEKGQPDELKPGLVESLVMDKAGRFVNLDLPEGDNARKLALVRVDPKTGKKGKPLSVKLAEPVNQAHLLGLDDAGRAYLEVTFGAIEKPDRRQVLVVSAEGKLLQGIPVPPPPTEFRMVHPRAVLPKGGFLSATDTPGGLEIRLHPLAP